MDFSQIEKISSDFRSSGLGQMDKLSEYCETGKVEGDPFLQMCQTWTSPKECRELVNLYIEKASFKMPFSGNYIEYGFYRIIYNKYIGWGIPSPAALKLIFDAYQKHLVRYPQAKLIDLGAGTGIYSLLLSDMGIPRERMIAVDLTKKTHKTCRELYPVVIDDQYRLDPEDVVLIVWGVDTHHCRLDRYVEEGGTCVILQGEADGCTLETGWFEDKPEWKIYEKGGLPSAVSSYAETITINTRYK
jgi:hypothetical protein